MTVKECIDFVDAIKPNAFTNDQKTAWLNEVESMVQTQVFLWAVNQVIRYDYDTDKDREMLVAPPHDKLYRAYLTAMIDFANGEYDKYANTMTMFNMHYGEFMRWFAITYRPADTHREVYHI